MARPKGTGKYRKSYDHQAYVACVEGGFTMVKLGKLFNVSKQTIHAWKNEHPSFLDSVKRGTDEFNQMQAEDSLLKRIKGYTYKETTNEPRTDKDGKSVLAVTKVVTKSVAPDPTSIIFFLKNRDPERWRDKKVVEHEGGIDMAIIEARRKRISEQD